MSDKKKGLTRQEIAAFNESRKGLEVDYLDEITSSRKRAWIVTAGLFVITLGAVGHSWFVSYRYDRPLPPHIVFLNPANHEVQQVKITRDEASYGDEIDKFWLTNYVIHRESYDFYSQQVDYDAVGLMSTPEVAESYLSKFRGKNGMSKVLGDSESTRVTINSVLLDRAHNVATVRFTTTRRSRSNAIDDPPKRWIAIMEYKYSALAMNDSQRYVNPLGFRVRSYRVTPEVN